jgi:acyl transferase domain-containing protein
MVSTVTGRWVSADEIADPGYWARHARQPVRFADAVGSLLTERPDIVLLEVGPGATLSSLVRQHPDLPLEVTIGTTLPHRGADADERVFVRRSIAEIWAAGVDVDWVAVNGARRGRVPLPTYPFARDRYWIERADPPASVRLDGAERRPADLATTADVTLAANERGPGAGSRKMHITAQLTAILADMSGLQSADIDPAASFGDLGFDSLFLTQLNAQFRREFKVRITLAQMFSETPSVGALAEYLDGVLDPEVSLATVETTGAQARSLEPLALVGAEQVRDSASSNGDSSHAPADLTEQLIKEQLRVMDQQLDLMRAQVMGSAHRRGSGRAPGAEKSDES